MEAEMVLQEHGIELQRADLEFLKGPCFVTDRLIDFYLGDLFSGIEVDDISYVPSAVTYMLARSNDANDVANCLGHSGQYPGKLVLFPLNNDRDLDRIDVRPDTHWSLLVLDSFQRVFIHFDIAHEESNDYCLELAQRIFNNVRIRVEQLERMKDEANGERVERTPYEFRRVRAADPTMGFNKYDCGLHVIAMATTISDWYQYERGTDRGLGYKDRGLGYEALIQEMDPEEEDVARAKIKELILEITGEDIMKLLRK